jgi:hypothetical protein
VRECGADFGPASRGLRAHAGVHRRLLVAGNRIVDGNFKSGEQFAQTAGWMVSTSPWALMRRPGASCANGRCRWPSTLLGNYGRRARCMYCDYE